MVDIKVVPVKDASGVILKASDIEGKTKVESLVYLGSRGLEAKAATKFYEDNKPERKAGFAARFYELLESGILAEKDFDALLASESDNVKNHRSHYGAIRELTNSIHAAKKAVASGSK